MAAILTKIHFAPNVIRMTARSTRRARSSIATRCATVGARGRRSSAGKRRSASEARTGRVRWMARLAACQLDGPQRPEATGNRHAEQALGADGRRSDRRHAKPFRRVLFDPFDTTNGSNVVTVHHSSMGFVRVISSPSAMPMRAAGLPSTGNTRSRPHRPVIPTLSSMKTNASSNQTTVGGYVDFVGTFAGGLTDGTGGLGYGTGVYSAGTMACRRQTSSCLRLDLRQLRRDADCVSQRRPALCVAACDGLSGNPAQRRLRLGDGVGDRHGLVNQFRPGPTPAGVQSNLNQNITGLVRAGQVYRVTFDVSRSPGR